MVDLGPVSPWRFRFIPKTAVEGLELWHAAWERDHPELLEPLGSSFYRPDLDHLLLEAEPWPVGVTVAESGAALRAVFGRGGYASSDRTINDLPPFPDSMVQKRLCPHEAGQWVWSERLGRLWRCTECPKATTR